MSWLTDATVKTAEEKAAEQAEQVRQAAKRARDAALQAMVHTTAAGDAIQCRPQDELHIRNALEMMGRNGETSRTWIAADNSVVTVTADDLQDALVSGQEQAAAIFAAYMS